MKKPKPTFNISAVGVCLNEGEIVQKTGCAIRLEFIDEYGRVATRTIMHSMGSADSDWANVQAARLGLAAIQRPYRKSSKVILRVVPRIIELVSGNDKSFKHSKQLMSLRQWIGFFTDLTLVPMPGEQIDCYLDAKVCAETQDRCDSGTRIKD